MVTPQNTAQHSADKEARESQQGDVTARCHTTGREEPRRCAPEVILSAGPALALGCDGGPDSVPAIIELSSQGDDYGNEYIK